AGNRPRQRRAGTLPAPGGRTGRPDPRPMATASRTRPVRRIAMSELGPQKDGMDVLEAWLDRYNERVRAAIPLDSGGEAGGAQLRLKYAPAEGMISILHLVAASRGGRPVSLVNRLEGPTAETSVQAELGGRRTSG